MYRGVYTAAAGGLISQQRIDTVANNLANVNTAGFKAQRIQARQQEFADTLASKMNGVTDRAQADFDRTPGVVDGGSYTDFSAGPVTTTGNPLNVALRNPNEFFVIQTPTGPAYTRAGDFAVDTEGNLVTLDNMPVSGDGGPLTLPQGPARILDDGSVIVGTESVGKLQVVRINDTSKLKHAEGSRFTLEAGTQPESVDVASVVPESLEMPNVNVVEAMVEMINAQKSFESYTKTVQTMDDMNETALRTARSL